jgi:hypothetical protein
MARDVNVECESEHVHSVVWYRVNGYTTFMDVNMEFESEPVHSVVWRGPTWLV